MHQQYLFLVRITESTLASILVHSQSIPCDPLKNLLEPPCCPSCTFACLSLLAKFQVRFHCGQHNSQVLVSYTKS